MEPPSRHHYPRSIGRRKSWILPLQAASAALMIGFGSWAESRLLAGDAVGITALFFVLVLLAATQESPSMAGRSPFYREQTLAMLPRVKLWA